MAEKPKLTTWDWVERLSKVLSLLVIPLLLWGIRVEIFMSRSPSDGELMRHQILSEVEARFDALPPQFFREKVSSIEEQTRVNHQDIQEVKLAMARMQADVSAIRMILNDG